MFPPKYHGMHVHLQYFLNSNWNELLYRNCDGKLKENFCFQPEQTSLPLTTLVFEIRVSNGFIFNSFLLMSEPKEK